MISLIWPLLLVGALVWGERWRGAVQPTSPQVVGVDWSSLEKEITRLHREAMQQVIFEYVDKLKMESNWPRPMSEEEYQQARKLLDEWREENRAYAEQLGRELKR